MSSLVRALQVGIVWGWPLAPVGCSGSRGDRRAAVRIGHCEQHGHRGIEHDCARGFTSNLGRFRCIRAMRRSGSKRNDRPPDARIPRRRNNDNVRAAGTGMQ